MVERHLELTQHLARSIREPPDLELLAEVPLNVVCFRFHPPGLDDDDALDRLNRALGKAVVEEGRAVPGVTRFLPAFPRGGVVGVVLGVIVVRRAAATRKGRVWAHALWIPVAAFVLLMAAIVLALRSWGG
jgi:hypothetical protein